MQAKELVEHLEAVFQNRAILFLFSHINYTYYPTYDRIMAYDIRQSYAKPKQLGGKPSGQQSLMAPRMHTHVSQSYIHAYTTYPLIMHVHTHTPHAFYAAAAVQQLRHGQRPAAEVWLWLFVCRTLLSRPRSLPWLLPPTLRRLLV